MARFYADENFPLPVVVALRERGHDVLTAHEDGKANQKIPDDEVLQRASQQGRALLSMNRRDFAMLHRTHAKHTGIVLGKYEVDFVAQAANINTKELELSGQLIRIERGNS